MNANGKVRQLMVFCLLMGLLFVGCTSAEKPRCSSGFVWTMPRGGDFVGMLDNVDQWSETARVTDVFGCADHVINRTYTDEELLYLPSYSPDLNPIEHFGSRLKKHLSKRLQDAEDAFQLICDVCNFFCLNCTNVE